MLNLEYLRNSEINQYSDKKSVTTELKDGSGEKWLILCRRHSGSMKLTS